MSGKIIPNLRDLFEQEFMETRRCQLDWERSSLVEYDYVPDGKFSPEKSAETQRFSTPRNVREYAEKSMTTSTSPIFQYFLDGSRRTYRVADVPIGSQCFPIIAGQIGIGICKRENKRMSAYSMTSKIVVSVPRKLDDESDKNEESHNVFFENKRKELNRRLQEDGSRIQIDKILYYNGNSDDNFEDKAVAMIQSYMIDEEKRSVSELVKANCLRNGVWLVKDGSLEYVKTNVQNDPFSFSKIRNNYKRVLGISKSFNPELAKLKGGKSASRMIAELKPFHRTPAFRYETPRSDGEFAIWYLRIREPRNNWGVFDGVVKVEKILVTNDERDQGMKTDEVDKISGWILNERNPVCYGQDVRWANHLYPIFLTETYVKSKFLSADHFINLF